MVTQVVKIHYAGHDVGALSFDPDRGAGLFEYEKSFVKTGLELSPLKMPLRDKQIYSFPGLSFETFKGLPGMIADSLPDDFGNAVLNAWVARQGKNPADITPLERLQYTGMRGMGALEYRPAKRKGLSNKQDDVALDELVRVAQEVIDNRNNFEAHLAANDREDAEAMRQLLQVGMSAGGARPKAVLAFNEDFSAAKSGQVEAPEGWTHYLMKFDGVSEHNAGREVFGDPLGYGAMEFVYSLMARNAGIHMAPCKLLHEGNRRHFLTQRFDRVGNRKVHMQTLNAMAHVDYKKPGSFSYYEVFGVARELGLSLEDAEQILRRMLFNIVARNHDDHSKNWAFLMNETGVWALSPAYDLAYSYKPGSPWVNSHWLTLNGRRDGFVVDDLHSISETVRHFTPDFINKALEQVLDAVAQWPMLAREYEVPESLIDEVQKNLRMRW